MLHAKTMYYNILQSIAELANNSQLANEYKFTITTLKVNKEVSDYRKKFL